MGELSLAELAALTLALIVPGMICVDRGRGWVVALGVVLVIVAAGNLAFQLYQTISGGFVQYGA